MRKLFSIKKHEINQYIEFVIFLDGIEEHIINELEQEREEIQQKGDGILYEEEYFYVYKDYWKKWWNSCNEEFLHECAEQFKITQDENIKGLFNYYIIELNKKIYKLNYEYEFKGETSILLYFEVASKIKNEVVDEYDKELESIKLFIKEVWLKKVEKRGKECKYKIVWLEDTQSVMLSNSCYLKINLVENLLRKLINQIMIDKGGLNWQKVLWKSPVEEKYLQRKNNYNQLVRGFSNIDDFLLSLDANDLVKIMDYKEELIDISELSVKLDELEKKRYLNAKKVEMIFDEIIKNHKKKSKSIWDRYFSDLFDVKSCYEGEGEKSPDIMKSKFRGEWSKLCQYRNHIAHNKFIDYSFYNELVQQLENITSQIYEAEKEFELQLDDEKNTIGYCDPLTGEYCEPKELIYKKEREIIIYKEISWFTKDIEEMLSEMKTIDTQVHMGFRYYPYELEDERESEFVRFIESFKGKNEPVVFITAKNSNVVKLQISKRKNELTSYYIECVLDDEVVLRTEISHNGYDFCCEGMDEDHPFVGGNWGNFKRDVKRKLEDVFKMFETNTEQKGLSIEELINLEYS